MNCPECQRPMGADEYQVSANKGHSHVFDQGKLVDFIDDGTRQMAINFRCTICGAKGSISSFWTAPVPRSI